MNVEGMAEAYFRDFMNMFLQAKNASKTLLNLCLEYFFQFPYRFKV